MRRALLRTLLFFTYLFVSFSAKDLSSFSKIYQKSSKNLERNNTEVEYEKSSRPLTAVRTQKHYNEQTIKSQEKLFKYFPLNFPSKTIQLYEIKEHH